ncbi:hypothetical protein FM107_14625 [Sphingobacterium sp. JB170]|nr:hypothetical protein FM107_14625 [Sphingobacterium sp. JB170]
MYVHIIHRPSFVSDLLVPVIWTNNNRGVSEISAITAGRNLVFDGSSLNG